MQWTEDTARYLAYAFHQGQKDKGGANYIDHPRRVATIAKAAGGSEHVVMAAWLHDTLEEDTPLRSSDLEEWGCPEEVVAAVVALTHGKYEPLPQYWARVKANPIALAVKTADITDNTDPVRLAVIEATDPETAARLREKYARASKALGIEQPTRSGC